MWGIHNDTTVDLIGGNFVSIGWDEVGDLRALPSDRAALKAVLRSGYPDAKEGAYPVWAGILYRFGTELAPGDLIVSPQKSDRTLNFAEVTGPYYWDQTAESHRHRVPVRWKKTGISRSLFSQDALYEIGSAVTLFRVKHFEPEEAVRRADETPSASRIDTYTRDFIADRILHGMSHEEFEEFVAELLRTVGYQARVTPYSNDGGVDVIAHRDPFGLEPPVIKVQCKHLTGNIGAPEVNQLTGTLARGELALFVSLGAYTKDAQALERNRQDLRLIGGDEVIDLVLANYEKLPARWQSIMPLRRILVVDQQP
jgi:restriction system protein